MPYDYADGALTLTWHDPPPANANLQRYLIENEPVENTARLYGVLTATGRIASPWELSPRKPEFFEVYDSIEAAEAALTPALADVGVVA